MFNRVSALGGLDLDSRFFSGLSRKGEVSGRTWNRCRADQSRTSRTNGLSFGGVGASGVQSFQTGSFQEFLGNRFHRNISERVPVFSDDYREPLEAALFSDQLRKKCR